MVRLLDFVPAFTNELRDTPRYVEEGKVFCNSGRVLDVKTGNLLCKVAPEIVRSYKQPLSIGAEFAGSGVERHHPRVKVAGDLFLRHAQEAEGWQRGTLEIAAESESGKPLWTFSIKHLGRHIGSYRLVPPFIYMLVSDEDNSKPHPTKEHYALPNPTGWHFVTLTIETGEVIQDFSLGDEKHSECRIEDVDTEGLLIGRENKKLKYYRRIQPIKAETQPSDNADVE
jgi:hypothetical protein